MNDIVSSTELQEKIGRAKIEDEEVRGERDRERELERERRCAGLDGVLNHTCRPKPIMG